MRYAGGGGPVLGITQVPVVGRGFPRLPAGICFMCPQQRYTKGMTKPRLNGFASELSHPAILSGPISTVLYKDNSISRRLCEESAASRSEDAPYDREFIIYICVQWCCIVITFMLVKLHLQTGRNPDTKKSKQRCRSDLAGPEGSSKLL